LGKGQDDRPDLDASGFERELTTDLEDATPDKPRGWPLHRRILAGLGVGVIAGLAANLVWGGSHPALNAVVFHFTEPVGALFLRGLLMIVVPLIASSLVVGVAGIGDVRRLGRIGLRSFAYSFVISAISVIIGLTLANTLRPGNRVRPETAEMLKARYGSEAEKRVEAVAAERKAAPESPLMQVVKTIVPANPIGSVAGVMPGQPSVEFPQMLQLMFFSLLGGVALTLVPGKAAEPLLKVLEGVYAVSAKIVDMMMQFAPYAVACLLFTNVARFGVDLLGALSWFVFTVLLGLGLQMFGVYSLSVAVLSRISPLEFFRRVKTVMLTAFSTSSSNATLPTALRVSEANLGVPREINSFVLTVGATANQNGTALYEGVTVLFLAQLAGVDLTLGQQIMVVYLAILGGIGTAGVPSGSIPFIVLVLATVNVNPALIAIILGVDRLLDMCRTTLNVVGDLTVATYVARAEGYPLLHVPPAKAAPASV
jgi:DAACS family dicarboxylate/amino acid:cation (Na+ or H+) symporter